MRIVGGVLYYVLMHLGMSFIVIFALFQQWTYALVALAFTISVEAARWILRLKLKLD